MDQAGRKTRPYRTFRDQGDVDAVLAALAIRQHAVFTLAQVCEVGLSASAVRGRAAAGRLHRVYRGVYALVPSRLLGREGRFMAAVLVCGPGAALSHRSAAALRGLRRTDRANIEVTVPSRAPRRQPRIDIHRSTTLRAADMTRIQNIPCTTVARTLLDLADVMQQRVVERAFDQAEILEVLDLRAVEAQIERNRHRRGARRVRAVLEEHYSGQTPTWSELEEAVLTLCRSARLPTPEVNVLVVVPQGPPIRVDFLWSAHRLVVESDGHRTHRTRQAFERDRRRDQRLVLAGWRTIRVTWRQIRNDPATVEATLRALLGV